MAQIATPAPGSKKRRAFLNAEDFDKAELRNRARSFLEDQSIEGTKAISQTRRTYSIDLEESLHHYDAFMAQEPHDHHLACLMCDYIFYVKAALSFESLNAFERGILNKRWSRLSGFVISSRFRAMQRLYQLGSIELNKGRAHAGEGWLLYCSKAETPFAKGIPFIDIATGEWHASKDEEVLSFSLTLLDDDDHYSKEVVEVFWDDDDLPWMVTH